MSKMTTLVGPPRDSGMLDRMRASVTAVATSPSASTCSRTFDTLASGPVCTVTHAQACSSRCFFPNICYMHYHTSWHSPQVRDAYQLATISINSICLSLTKGHTGAVG